MIQQPLAKLKDIYVTYARSLKSTLLFWFLTLSIIPFVTVAWYGYIHTVQSVDEMQRNKLSDTAALDVATLNDRFYEATRNLQSWSKLRLPQEILSSVSRHFEQSGQNIGDFIHSPEYKKLIASQPKTLIKLAEQYSYVYDIFLIDLEGNILYSINKEADLGTNLISGPYSETRFARAYRMTRGDGQAHFSDLERYEASKDILAGFITQPIRNDLEEIIGVIGVQLNMDVLFDSMNSKDKVLHQYLIGADGLLRTKINDQSEVLNRRISTEVFWSWYREHGLHGEYSDTMDERAVIYIGPEGKKMLGKHNSINLLGVRWAHISEIEESEASAVPNTLFIDLLILTLLGIVVVVIVSTLIAKRIVKPIALLLNASNRYMSGERGVQVKLATENEIGEFATVFNALIQKQEHDAAELDFLAKKSQKTLDELKEQKYALDAHSIVAITDVKGVITFANRKFEEISGYTNEELIGKNHRILNSGFHPREFWQEMYQTIKNGGTWHNEVCNITKDGHLYWVNTTIVPFLGEDNKPISFIALRTDITERKAIEAELIEAKNSAEAAVQAKSEFLATMSHEIRTPMNGVLGMLGLLLHSNLDETQSRQIRVASNSANSLLGIINDILDFSKVEAGKMELEMIEFNLRNELESFIESIAFRAQEKGLELILDTTHLMRSTVITDPGRIRQILTNIIGNAVKFTHRGEIHICVSLEEVDVEHGKLRIDVHDTGIGIAADKIGTLFQSFSQADNSTTRKYGGTGLGLAIVKKLCELLGGSVWITSVENEGSTFHVEIGVRLGEMSDFPAPNISVEGRSLLLVDDNKTNRAVMRAQLEQWGMNVYEAEDSVTALELCKLRIAHGSTPPYEVALIDMQMPTMEGTDLGEEIRNIAECDKMKMGIMTPLESHYNAQHFAEIGFNAFFSKPSTTKNLLNALNLLFDNEIVRKGINPLIAKNNLSALLEEKEELEWPSNTRILLVEDNPTNQIVAQGMLDMIGLYADIANNGLEALEAMNMALKIAPYTLILMDCQMPELDGYETSIAIRRGEAGEAYKEVPIVAMTANAMAGDREKCLISGMSDYISKPINLAILKAALIKWLQAKNTPREKIAEEAKEESIELKIWDEADALSRLGGRKDFLLRIMRSIVDDSANMMSALKEAIRDEDLPNAQLHAHSIKGSAGNVSAFQLQELAKKMEFAAKNGEIGFLKEEFANLKRAMQDVVERFEEEFSKA